MRSEPRSRGPWQGIDDFFEATKPDVTLPEMSPERYALRQWADAHPERLDGQQPGEDPDAYPGASPYDMDQIRSLEELFAQALGDSAPSASRRSLPYCACAASEDGAVTMDPSSFRLGPPGRISRAPALTRPLRKAVDAWLAAGGWQARRDGAASLALVGEDSQEARNRVRDQWRYEMRCRGWEGAGDRWITRRWREESDGSTRMYWWTTERAPDLPPPPPAD